MNRSLILVVDVVLLFCASGSWAAHQTKFQPAVETSEQKAKAVILKQEGDTITAIVAPVDGGPEKTLTFHATDKTKLTGAESSWHYTGWKNAHSSIAGFDLRGKTAEVTFRGDTVTGLVMKTACNEDRCPKKGCAKRCGAMPCSCSATK